MNKLLLSALLILFVSTTKAQIKYEKDYVHALDKSRSAKQPIFLILIPQSNADEHKIISGLGAADVSQFYNTHFVNLKLTVGRPEAVELTSKYGINRFPAYVFIDTNEHITFKSFEENVDTTFFTNMGKEVIGRLASNTTLYDLDLKYANGEVSREFFKDYIDLRIRTGNTDNSKLIEFYVNYLTIGEFEDPQEILFIFRAGPNLSGKAYKLLYTDRELTDATFWKLPLAERIVINTRIGNNTLDEAINKHNISMAVQASELGRTSHGNDYKAGNKRANWNMMVYYRGVKDTAKFFSSATQYYDSYYMTVSMDSVQRANAKIKDGAPGKNAMAELLNNAAWEFYVLGAKGNLYLSKAMLWSKRSLELDDNPNYYDTLAHIFYRMGLYDDAILNENKAVRFSNREQSSKFRVPGFKEELKKMQERTL